MPVDDGPAGGQEVVVGILGVQPALDRGAVEAHLVLREVELLALRDADLFTDDVDAGHALGNRVLDLQAGVDLEEVELAVRRQDELDRSGAPVAHRAARGDRSLAHAGAQLGGQRGGGGLFDDLLVAALDAALALEQVDEVIVRVAQDLDLDVARPFDVLLDEQGVVAEGAFRFALRAFDGLREPLRAALDAHALAAAASARLEQQRVAYLPGLGDQTAGGLVVARVAGHDGDARRPDALFGFLLRAHRADRVRRGTDEDEPCLLASGGEAGVLRQKTEARVHGIGSGATGRRDQLFDVEVRLAAGCGPDAHRLIGAADKRRIGVGVGEHRHRGNTHAPGRSLDTQGYLAAVGDEDFRDAPHEARRLSRDPHRPARVARGAS